MLTETFIASILAGPKSAAASALPKEAAIFLHDFQPLSSLKGTLKKSSTNPNCLVATSTHIFAAQSDKALVNVYSRELGNQETFVPFEVRITSVARVGTADGAAILALGTEAGGLLLWELFTGRRVSTQRSHLQAVVCLTVDPTSNFIISGSTDSSIQVWSVPGLLSFTDPGIGDSANPSRDSPLRQISIHRGAITSIVTGHSHTNVDFAISASEDRTCLVWNYRTGEILHTFIITETPLCLAVDPADRGFYAGMLDGSVQFINFHKAGSGIHLLYDVNASDTPTQATESDRWRSATPVGKISSISVSYDGTIVLTGHEHGKVLAWEIGRPPTEIADLAQSVTNLMIVPPTGFPSERKDPSGIKQVTVVKPRQNAFPHTAESGLRVPQAYNFTGTFSEHTAIPKFTGTEGRDTLFTRFNAAMADEYFPDDLLRAAIAEVSGLATTPDMDANTSGVVSSQTSASEEVAELRMQLKLAEFQNDSLIQKLTTAHEEIEKRNGLARMKERAKMVKLAKNAKIRERLRKKEMGESTSSNGGDAQDQGPSDSDSDEDMGRD